MQANIKSDNKSDNVILDSYRKSAAEINLLTGKNIGKHMGAVIGNKLPYAIDACIHV